MGKNNLKVIEGGKDNPVEPEQIDNPDDAQEPEPKTVKGKIKGLASAVFDSSRARALLTFSSKKALEKSNISRIAPELQKTILPKLQPSIDRKNKSQNEAAQAEKKMSELHRDHKAALSRITSLDVKLSESLKSGSKADSISIRKKISVEVAKRNEIKDTIERLTANLFVENAKEDARIAQIKVSEEFTELLRGFYEIEAKRILNRYFTNYIEAEDWTDSIDAFCRKHGIACYKFRTFRLFDEIKLFFKSGTKNKQKNDSIYESYY